MSIWKAYANKIMDSSKDGFTWWEGLVGVYQPSVKGHLLLSSSAGAFVAYGFRCVRYYAPQQVNRPKTLPHDRPEPVNLGAIMPKEFERRLFVADLGYDAIRTVGTSQLCDLGTRDPLIFSNCSLPYCANIRYSSDWSFADRAAVGVGRANHCV